MEAWSAQLIVESYVEFEGNFVGVLPCQLPHLSHYNYNSMQLGHLHHDYLYQHSLSRWSKIFVMPIL
jgi:hypothetical protein